MEELTRYETLRLGFARARKITREHAKIFYFSSKFLPRPKQDATYAIYVVCRDSDEAVDDMKSFQKQERLSRVREDIESAYSNCGLEKSTLLAFRETVKRFQIPAEYFYELIEGMQMDLDKNRYRDFQDLSSYCYKVAGVIGLIMLKVFECDNPEVEKYAIDLGTAMQLTNILRDIKEDWDKGRVYLPQDEMDSFGVSEKNIAQGRVDDNFKRLMEFQIKRARSYYVRAMQGLRFVSSRRLRFIILSMQDMYSGILDEIEQHGFDVFSRRIHIYGPKKAYIVFKNLLRA